MNPQNCAVYRHSGKFGVHGPVLTIFVAIGAAFILGLVYSYLIKWIPIIIFNFLLTAGYGFVFGLLTGFILKFCKVRNTMVTVLSGMAVGFIAVYFNWNGHIHALFDDVPWLLLPNQIFAVMEILYREGSWGLTDGSPVTGITLGIVWAVEALIIIGFSVLIPMGMIDDTPYCEETQCWLDEEKKVDTLGPIQDPRIFDAVKAGDLTALNEVLPKVPGAANFTRLVLKHSESCKTFFTVRVENILMVADKNGKESEKVQRITNNLVLPISMFEYFSQLGKRAPGDAVL